MATREGARQVSTLAKAIQADVDQILQKKDCPLSPREQKILSLAASGKQIARELRISHCTVRNYGASIRKRLGVSSTIRAVVLALQHGWIAFPE